MIFARPSSVSPLAVFAIAAALGGCGGGSGAAATAVAQIDKAGYITRVDAICAAYGDRVTRSAQHFEATEHRAGAGGESEAASGAYRRLAGLLDQMVKRIRGVPAPSADQATIDAWLAATHEQARDQRALAVALEDPRLQASALNGLQAGLRRAADAERQAISDYGFKSCGPP